MKPEASERSKLLNHVSNRQRYAEHQPLVSWIDQSECLDFTQFSGLGMRLNFLLTFFIFYNCSDNVLFVLGHVLQCGIMTT